MKPLDLSGLIQGLMLVISLALATGQYEKLRTWAIKDVGQGSYSSPLLKQRRGYFMLRLK